MRFLTDQDVYAQTVAFVRGLGHEVDTASERGLSRGRFRAAVARGV